MAGGYTNIGPAIRSASNNTLHDGECMNAFRSEHILRLQDDGDLVLFKDGDVNKEKWRSRTGNTGPKPFTLTLRENGALVLRNGNGKEVWSAGPDPEWGRISNKTVYRLELQSDLNLVLYRERPDSAPEAYWATNTKE